VYVCEEWKWYSLCCEQELMREGNNNKISNKYLFENQWRDICIQLNRYIYDDNLTQWQCVFRNEKYLKFAKRKLVVFVCFIWFLAYSKFLLTLLFPTQSSMNRHPLFFSFLFQSFSSHLFSSFIRHTYSQEELMIDIVMFLLQVYIYIYIYSIETCHQYWELYSGKVMKGKQHHANKPYTRTYT